MRFDAAIASTCPDLFRPRLHSLTALCTSTQTTRVDNLTTVSALVHASPMCSPTLLSEIRVQNGTMTSETLSESTAVTASLQVAYLYRGSHTFPLRVRSGPLGRGARMSFRSTSLTEAKVTSCTLSFRDCGAIGKYMCTCYHAKHRG